MSDLNQFFPDEKVPLAISMLLENRGNLATPKSGGLACFLAGSLIKRFDTPDVYASAPPLAIDDEQFVTVVEYLESEGYTVASQGLIGPLLAQYVLTKLLEAILKKLQNAQE